MAGNTYDSDKVTLYALSRENPWLRAKIPHPIPRTKPTSPMMALISPPPILSIILRGHPRNMRAPTITKKPRTNLTTGFDPALATSSFFEKAIMAAPRMSPMISGLMYCTGAAW